MLFFCTCSCLFISVCIWFYRCMLTSCYWRPGCRGSFSMLCVASCITWHSVATLPVCTNPTLRSSMTLNWSLYTYSSPWFSESRTKWCTTRRQGGASKEIIRQNRTNFNPLWTLDCDILSPVTPWADAMRKRERSVGEKNQAMYKENCHEIS